MERSDRLKAIDDRIAALAKCDPRVTGETWTAKRFDGAQTVILARDASGKGPLLCNVTGDDPAELAARADFFAASLDDIRFLREEVARMDAAFKWMSHTNLQCDATAPIDETTDDRATTP